MKAETICTLCARPLNNPSAGCPTHHLRLLNTIAALRECLRECADDLASSLIDQYGGDIRHPVQRRRWERDMEPVVKARKLLGDK